jgi:hypothetical protein
VPDVKRWQISAAGLVLAVVDKPCATNELYDCVVVVQAPIELADCA